MNIRTVFETVENIQIPGPGLRFHRRGEAQESVILESSLYIGMDFWFPVPYGKSLEVSTLA